MSTPRAKAMTMQGDHAAPDSAIQSAPGASGDGGTVRRVVIVLVKAPVPGRVKTRLTPPVPPWGAADLAAAALLDTLDAAAATPRARVLVALEGSMSDAVRAGELTTALAGHTVVAQRGESLGERIAAAHADVAEAFPEAVSVLIGMDSPQLDAGLLDDALGIVESGAGAALGPALDGGWWALALADPGNAALITDVPTSTGDTGRHTLAALRAGLGHDAVATLPLLSDVDTVEDALRVRELVPDGRFARAVAHLSPVAGRVGP